MLIFVAGASGILGQAAIPRLIESGHRVIGLCKTTEGLVRLDRLGAAPVLGDVLDPGSMARLIAEHRAEVVINLATAIPLRLKIVPADWEMNDRIRSAGTRSLLTACMDTGAQLFVQESVGYVCASRGSEWITEDSQRTDHPFMRATVEMEDMVRASGVPSVVMRFAALMSPDSWHTQQSVAALRRGMLPIIGSGDAFVSMIHADDAGAAIASVVERAEVAAGKTYNIVDNAPATMNQVLTFAAASLRAPKPKAMPPFLVKLAVGSLTLDIMAASYRMSNAKARSDLAFDPNYQTYVETWKQISEAVKEREFALSDILR